MHRTGKGRSRSGAGHWVVLGVAAALLAATPFGRVEAGLGRRVDPAQVLPLDQIRADQREVVAEVIREHTLHRQGEPESFPCNAGLYLSLVNEPVLTLSLWKDLAEAPVQLRRIGPDRYQGEDGNGATATWDYVLRTPRLHVLLAYLNYASPRNGTRVDARIVLIVHSGFYREVNGEPYVQHDVEAFVKVDSKGWKTLARTLRPVVERILEEQVREAGQFVSLMSRLVVTYPDWATQVAVRHDEIDEQTRARFRDIVAQNRKPNASTGRPMVMANAGRAAQSPEARRR
ncbi:MAG: hypothetical protein U0790_16155 [Isosphaeraceae bacterium]